MKKVAMLLLALSLGAQAASYSNSSDGFSMTYPDSWTKSEAVKQAAVALVGPRQNGFSRNINVVVQSGLPSGITLDQILEASQSGLAKAISGFKVSSQRSVKVGSENGREIVYTGKLTSQTNLPLRWRQRYTVHGGKLFVITQTSLASDSGADKVMNTALDSFKFLK